MVRAVCKCCDQAIVENVTAVHNAIDSKLTLFGSKVDCCFDPLATRLPKIYEVHCWFDCHQHYGGRWTYVTVDGLVGWLW